MAVNIAKILKKAYLELRSLVSVAWQQASDGVFLLRAGLCCPGCRGWRQKGSTWRSLAGSSTQRSSTHSATTVSTSSRSIIFILVSICTRLCAVSLLFCLYFILFFPCSLFCLYPSTFSHMTHLFPSLTSLDFFCLWLKFYLCLCLLPVSRCWGPPSEHDSADQRPSPVVLLGRGQETFLHRQRQHGLEIPGHCISDTPHIIKLTKKHKRGFTLNYLRYFRLRSRPCTFWKSIVVKINCTNLLKTCTDTVCASYVEQKPGVRLGGGMQGELISWNRKSPFFYPLLQSWVCYWIH